MDWKPKRVKCGACGGSGVSEGSKCRICKGLGNHLDPCDICRLVQARKGRPPACERGTLTAEET